MRGLKTAVSSMVALFLIGAGCNSRLLRPPVTIFADAGGRSITATVGDVERRFTSVLLSFFPSRVPLHPDDAVNFEVRDSGEPHTVALGRLVDQALAAVDKLGSTAGIKAVESLPQMRTLPLVLPKTVNGGMPRANESATERCFLQRGRPPVADGGGAPACPQRDQPAFDGTQSFYSSGFLEEGEPFRVKLSPKIRTGTYGFMCLVHRAAMTGSIEVRSPEVERPRVADVREQGRDEEDNVASSLDPAARRAIERSGRTVLAGTGPAGRITGLVSSFIPDVLEVRPDQPVTWQLYGMHSVSFRPTRRAQDGVLVEEKDGVRINLDAWRPIGSPAVPAAAVAYPPTSARLAIDGGTWSGDGTWSSGILRATPPSSITYTLRFAKPGAYRYLCLVHPRMRGRIEVTKES